MNTFNTNARHIHSKLNYVSMLSCFVVALLISHASCQQAKDGDVAATLNDSDYTDADDIEWGNFPIASDKTKGHPVIFYKEDIVSEDYDPNKDNQSTSSSKETKPQLRRKYKDINRRNRLNRTENYRYIKPEKVYFDVYPIEYDKANDDDSKFNDDDLQVEVISLLDAPKANDEGDGAYAKHQLNKRPKKVVRHHRQRRDLDLQQRELKRQQRRAAKSIYSIYFPFYYTGTRLHLKSTIRGTYINVPEPNPILNTDVDLVNRFGGDNENGWNIWARIPIATTARPTRPTTTTEPPKRRRPAPPIIHSGDEDYATNNQQFESAVAVTTPRTTTMRPRRTTTQPRTTFRPTARPTTTEPPALAPSPESLNNSWRQLAQSLEPTPVGIQPCVWAVSSCCKSQAEIQYTCFEYLGCIGDFWDVNPCSEDFFRNAVETVNNYLKS